MEQNFYIPYQHYSYIGEQMDTVHASFYLSQESIDKARRIAYKKYHNLKSVSRTVDEIIASYKEE